MSERLKLTVVSLLPQKPVGQKGAVLLPFKAKGEDGKEANYFTFEKAFFEHITPGAELDAEVDISQQTGQDGNTYTNRKVIQLYKNGQPLKVRVDPGFGPRLPSPEERASEEAQVAFKGVIELLVGKIIPDNAPLARLAFIWAGGRLGGGSPDVLPYITPTITTIGPSVGVKASNDIGELFPAQPPEKATSAKLGPIAAKKEAARNPGPAEANAPVSPKSLETIREKAQKIGWLLGELEEKIGKELAELTQDEAQKIWDFLNGKIPLPVFGKLI